MARLHCKGSIIDNFTHVVVHTLCGPRPYEFSVSRKAMFINYKFWQRSVNFILACEIEIVIILKNYILHLADLLIVNKRNEPLLFLSIPSG